MPTAPKRRPALTLPAALAASMIPAALIVAAAPLAAQSAEPVLARVDSVFAAFSDPSAPGCALAVVRDGRFAFSRGYGSANLDYGVPLDGRSVFYLASVSKQFTAAAVTLAAAEGRLDLDDEVRRWIHELPDYGSPLTVRQLVHHTSGLRDYLTLITLAGRRADDHWSDAALLELITRQRATNFTPGSEYLYSNTGYVLLAEIVRRATGASLRRYADERIFAPLGMRDTHFHDDAGRVIPRRVIGYARGGDGAFRLNHWFAFDKVGDGGLYSSAEDVARWEENFHDARVGGPLFTDAMHRRGVLVNGDTIPYASGLIHGSYRGLRTVSHGGSLAGFRTAVLRFPDERFSAIVLCNTPTAAPQQYAQRVAELFLADRMTPVQSGPTAASPVAAQRTTTPQPAVFQAELVRHAGRYYSDELDTVYTLEPGEGALVLHRGEARLTLQPRDTRTFAAGSGLVLHFDPDARGFTVEAGRVRGIRFIRQE